MCPGNIACCDCGTTSCACSSTPPSPTPGPPPTPAGGSVDLGPCANPPCFRIKNNCSFTSYAFAVNPGYPSGRWCCSAFSQRNPSIGIPNDGKVHEYSMVCEGHGRIAFGPADPNGDRWYAQDQVYSLVEPGPDGACASMNYDTSYIDTGFLMPLAARAQGGTCKDEMVCQTKYADAINGAPAQWVATYGGAGSQKYVLSYPKFCSKYPSDPGCLSLKQSAEKLSSSIAECNDPNIAKRSITDIAGCGCNSIPGDCPWARSSSCCAAVNFGLVDYIISKNKWTDWTRGADCANFYTNKYTSPFNRYQQWIENVCKVRYQYGFPYADHCGWSSDQGCDNTKRMDIVLCPMDK